jgi:hypothetical protein
VLTASSIPYELKDSVDRNNRIIMAYIDESLKTKNSPSSSDAVFEPLGDEESILQRAQRETRRAGHSDAKIVREHKVTGFENK